MEYKIKKILGRFLHHRIRKALYPQTWEDVLDEKTPLSITVAFPDGMEMDIKCVGVQIDLDRPIADHAAWTEAVLFNKNGCEVACTEPAEEFFGEWTIEHGDTTYVAVVL